MKKVVLAASAAMVLAACDPVQMNRDGLRYQHADRGSESYFIKGSGDSMDAAIRRSQHDLEHYLVHRQALTGQPLGASAASLIGQAKTLSEQLKDVEHIKLGTFSSSTKKLVVSSLQADYRHGLDQLSKAREDEGESRRIMAGLALNQLQHVRERLIAFCAEDEKACGQLDIAKMFTAEADNADKQSGGSRTFSLRNQLGPRNGPPELNYLWPETLTQSGVTMPDELIRALSSTASVAQMRDLLTEPTFPSMLPTERTVHLGCLPPPDSAAFEATMKLGASVKLSSKDEIGVNAEYASAVAKLFEESERTLFLQYALFRLCEMSINAPSGFRNVYPVIIHDIVRRTAEMNNLANKEAEERRKAEEETKRQEIALKVVTSTEASKQNDAYRTCMAAKFKKADPGSDLEKWEKECESAAKPKPKE